MKVLVTGGSGYLGVHVCRFFGADDFSRRAGRDILSAEDLPMIADYDLVIHLAAHLDKRPEAFDDCLRTNVQGTANVLAHVREGAAFVYASTKDVYGANAAATLGEVSEDCSTEYVGQSPLEWTKLLGERCVDYFAERRGLRACVFRLSPVYARPSEGNQPGFVTHYVESVKRGLPLRLPVGGAPVRDPLHVEDFARACQAFAESGLRSGVYNLGGGRKNAVSLREIAETVGRLIEREPVFGESPDAPAPVPFDYVSDITRAHAQLGWEPRISLREGLQDLI